MDLKQEWMDALAGTHTSAIQRIMLELVFAARMDSDDKKLESFLYVFAVLLSLPVPH